MKFIVDNKCSDRKQYRFPRTKRRRILKKWSKNNGNYRVIPWEYGIVVGDICICHPAMYYQLIAKQRTSQTGIR